MAFSEEAAKLDSISVQEERRDLSKKQKFERKYHTEVDNAASKVGI